MQHALSCITLALSSLWLSGCLVAVEHTGHEPQGTLSVEWLIDESDDSAKCVQGGARKARVVVWERSHVVDEVVADCRNFGVDIDVPPGRYWLTVQLLAANGDERTVEVDTDTIDVFSGDYEYVTVNFNADSFL